MKRKMFSETSVRHQTLMMGIEMDSETSVIFSHMSWQIAREDFVSTEEQFSIGDDKSTWFRLLSQEESQS
jgi:hypothetical protein